MKVFVNLDDAQEKKEFMEEQRQIRREIERRRWGSGATG